MFLIRKTYPNSDRIAWWDGEQWVDCNHHAMEFPRKLSAKKYAESRGLRADYAVVSVAKKDPKPVPVPLADRNGESNPRSAKEVPDA